MLKPQLALLLLLLMAGCVPLNQQVSYVPTGNERSIINDEKLYSELKYIIDNGIYELGENDPNWTGPCEESPVFKNGRFQSGYSMQAKDAFKIIDHMLTFRISYGGGCGCSDRKMVWNGQLITDEKGRQVAELVFSFKNIDMCRAMKFESLAFDLRSLDFGSANEVYIRINKFQELLYYKPI